MDFLIVSTRSTKRGTIEIYPKFIVKSSSDLMTRGGDFYAIWDESKGLWSTSEEVAINLIDKELDTYAKEHASSFGDNQVKVLHLWDADSCMIDRWHKYVQKQCWDNYHNLDEKIIFSNFETKKDDYASKKLSYPLQPGDCKAYEELVSTLYSAEERKKIEWAIGSIVCGESKYLQKFLVMYGSAGTGKSTILNIIQDLFAGYYCVFDAKALGSNSNSFALESFKSNPMVAIQHDGDLSHIEDNTKLNSVVSHELMTVNEKFKSAYQNRFNCFLFMGTNKPVKITDAKSGILRRLIDVTPSGNKVPANRYKTLISQIKFELGAIAYRCQEVYLNDPGAYDDYIPTSMMGESNDFYNFVEDYYDTFKRQDGTTLKAAWEMYKSYVEDAKIAYPLNKTKFKFELRNYFTNFDERAVIEEDLRVRNYYSGFIFDKFIYAEGKLEKKPELRLEFNSHESIFDRYCNDCPAQYASEKETPIAKWSDVTTILEDIDTTKLHYVKIPENHIVIDFDIKDKNGNKSLEANIQAASKFPETYAELSKSGSGIHLHYIYTGGDPAQLSRVYADNIEIKVYSGNSSLRRRLTKCNDKPIAEISSGLPLKGEKKVINFENFKSEKALRTMIKRNLNKEIHPGTKPSVDFIYKLLEDAYNSDLKYDVTDMRSAIQSFASGSTNQSDYCIKLCTKMHYKSEEASENSEGPVNPIVFYDVEVFPNLFLVNWKLQGKEHKVVRMINPKPAEIEDLLKYRLVGFNNRKYDNHMLYARMMGYTNEQLFNLSQRIISNDSNALFGEAYNLSYTDVYDFCSTKQSLKKWEIELGIHHKELGLPWDQPVPMEMWEKVAEYCDNDVIATEAVWDARKADFIAREILADVANGTVNDTTNSLTTKIIFGKERHPQDEFQYRDLSKPVTKVETGMYTFLVDATNMSLDYDGPQGKSVLPYFDGYTFEFGKSFYKGIEVGEGGRVWSKPGMYGRAKTYDVASMHPSSAIAEYLFGPYTERFKELLDARICIKHKDFDKAKTLLGGTLAKYLDNPDDAKALAQALKIAINSVYGLTAAKFDNPFRDKRNIDNIVAKRGALFMINLQEEVEKRGGEVIHIKTDSIKVLDPTPEIEQFIFDYGKEYGYNFEIEHIFEKICLVNDAVYIAKLAEDDPEDPGKWTATGTQFAVPYVFKTLFSHEPIQFEDMCETKSVSSALYLDFNEKFENRENNHDYKFVGKVGSFCPMISGSGGGELMREGKDKDGNIKYSNATGAKGYRWMESELVRTLGKENDIDKSYYYKLVDDAKDSISQYGDFEWFVA